MHGFLLYLFSRQRKLSQSVISLRWDDICKLACWFALSIALEDRRNFSSNFSFHSQFSRSVLCSQSLAVMRRFCFYSPLCSLSCFCFKRRSLLCKCWNSVWRVWFSICFYFSTSMASFLSCRNMSSLASMSLHLKNDLFPVLPHSVSFNRCSKASAFSSTVKYFNSFSTSQTAAYLSLAKLDFLFPFP